MNLLASNRARGVAIGLKSFDSDDDSDGEFDYSITANPGGPVFRNVIVRQTQKPSTAEQITMPRLNEQLDTMPTPDQILPSPLKSKVGFCGGPSAAHHTTPIQPTSSAQESTKQKPSETSDPMSQVEARPPSSPILSPSEHERPRSPPSTIKAREVPQPGGFPAMPASPREVLDPIAPLQSSNNEIEEVQPQTHTDACSIESNCPRAPEIFQVDSGEQALQERRKRLAEQHKRQMEAMQAQLSEEEERLREMESMQQRQAELAGKRAEMERARFEAQAALSEARLQEESEKIAKLEKETEELARRRKELEGRRMQETESLAKVANDMLESKRSLYDMMGAEAAANSREDQGITKTIYPVTEDPQTEREWDQETGRPTWREQHQEQEQREVLPGHECASNGDAAKLQSLIELDDTVPYQVDSINRTAGFYASANNQAACLQILAQHFGDSLQIPDANGDTPLHAAASTGSVECARCLLEGGANPDAENQLGMRSAHLAKERPVLELLAQYNGSMVAEDKQLRTPLFVACAMDRLDCAQFLCEVLDSEEELNHRDRRGDTPMHAAACNGAIHCLRMLLENGMNPDLRNEKSYRPIDLAARRGHVECERLLSEYHMHHSTENYFDSVLFLATLHGQQSSRDALEALDSQDQYEIIQRANPEASPDEIKKMHSMWMSRRSRSVRLQQFGSWIAYEDPTLKTVFWYNSTTQESQWDKPAEVIHVQNARLQEAKDSWESRKKTSMRMKRIGDWIEYHGQGGKTFYYNETSGEFQWERPVDLISRLSQEETAKTDEANDWAPYKDPNTGMRFWYNTHTGYSQWEVPEGISDEFLELEAPLWQDTQDQNEVHEIHDVNDLGI